jgi:hypothetical protein
MELEEEQLKNLTPYDVYVLYISMKIHFTSKGFDFFKSTYIPASSKGVYEKRKDKYFFKVLSGQTRKFYIDYFVSNFIQNKKFWIGDIEIGEKNYKKYLAKKDSLSYTFKSELKNLKKNLGENVEVKNDELPHLIKLYYEDKLSLDSLVMIIDFLKIHEFLDEKLTDNVLWENLSFLIRKYKRFFSYDVTKMKNIFVNFCKSCREEV